MVPTNPGPPLPPYPEPEPPLPTSPSAPPRTAAATTVVITTRGAVTTAIVLGGTAISAISLAAQATTRRITTDGTRTTILTRIPDRGLPPAASHRDAGARAERLAGEVLDTPAAAAAIVIAPTPTAGATAAAADDQFADSVDRPRQGDAAAAVERNGHVAPAVVHRAAGGCRQIISGAIKGDGAGASGLETASQCGEHNGGG